MIENEMLDELADFLGLREQIAGITARAMNGEIDFAGALNERVGLLKGLPVARLDEAAERIRYMPGGATLVATMKQARRLLRPGLGRLHLFHRDGARAAGLRLRRRQHAGARRPHAGRHGRAADPRQGSQARHARAALRRARPRRCPDRWPSATAPTTCRCCRPRASASPSAPSRRSRPKCRRASTMAISPRCSICRAIAGSDFVERKDP